jgi:hypothetical protein
MAIDRWEQRSGLWVRRRDDGDWDYFPTLREPAPGYRLEDVSFTRIEQYGRLGKVVSFGLGVPILCFSLIVLAARSDLDFLADPRSRGLLYILGLIIVVASSFARPMARQAVLKRAVASDTVLSSDELQRLGQQIGVSDFGDTAGPRPAISGGARNALMLALMVVASWAILIFVIALVASLETTMLVTGIVAMLCILLTMRLWYLSRESV